MKKTILIIIFLGFNLIALAQYRLCVFETKFISSPDLGHGGYVDHAWWSCNNPNLTIETGDAAGAIIHINHYFTGSAELICTYSYSYYLNNRINVIQGSSTYYVYCVESTATLSATSQKLEIGKTLKLTYSLSDTRYSSNAHPVWTSSNTDVATISSSGLVKAVSPGNALITLDPIVGPNAFCNVSVVSGIKPTSISISPESLEIEQGQTKQFSYTLFPIDSYSKILWSSSNPKIASISDTGLLTAKTGGQTVISASTDDGLSAHANVIVMSLPEKLTLRQPEPVFKGYSIPVIPEFYPPNSSSRIVSWKSSNNQVAEVDESGNVRAKGTGTTTITATSSNKLVGSCKVTVVDAPSELDYRSVKNKLETILDIRRRSK